jgi:hypothetical protein
MAASHLFTARARLDQIIEIANNCSPGMARKAKLQIDARKWIVSLMMPKLARGQG